MDWNKKAEITFDRAQMRVEGKEHNPHILGNIVWGGLWVITKACFRVTARGIENVTQFAGKGVVIVCDHVSYTDPVFQYVELRPRIWPRFMAKDDIMHDFFAWFFGMHGAFPVARDSADLSAVKRAVRYLKDGETVAIFPEGTRRGKGGVVLRMHAGAALIARMAKVPVVPSTVHNAEVIKRKGERLRFPKVTVEYGKPLYLKDFEWVPKPNRMEAFSWFAMRECFAMRQHVEPTEVDMHALFVDDNDYSDLFGSWRPGMEPPVVEAAKGKDKQ